MIPPPARAIGALPGGEPFLPEAGMVYWVETTVLAPGDPQERRPVVVVSVPATVDGTVTVVARSGTDGFGVEHPADPRLGLSVSGWFSRVHPVQCRSWTPSDVLPIGPLEDVTFTAVVARFGP